MDKEEDIKVSILLINDNENDLAKIEGHLGRDMRVPWNIVYCKKIEEARSRIHKADVIVLDLGLEGLATPREIFDDVEHIALEIPVIVLTGEDEHSLSTYVMEQGAADKIIRGKFGRLVDAIEFALIRQRITTGARKDTDKTLSDSQDKGAADLQVSRDQNLANQDRHKQILRMFSGGYAVDQQDKSGT